MNITPEYAKWLRYCTTAPKNDEQLWKYCKNVFGINIPREKICQSHCSLFEAFSDSYFCRSPVVIWKGPRGGGKSFLLALLALVNMTTLEKCKVFLLGGSRDQSNKVREYLKYVGPEQGGKFWGCPSAPRVLIAGDPTKTKLILINGSEVTALAASEGSTRGHHGQKLFIDEADCCKQDIYDGAQGIPTEEYGISTQVTISSTWQNPQGTMTNIIKNAEKENFPIKNFCWRETLQPHGWRTQKSIDDLRKNVAPHMWKREWECEVPKEGERIFSQEVLDRLFDRRLGEYKGDPHEEIRIIQPEKMLDFATGTDWGKQVHFTVMHTNSISLDNDRPDILACWKRVNVLDWDIIARELDERLREYGGNCLHDGTGVGEVIQDMLTEPAMPVDFRDTKLIMRMLIDYIKACQRGQIVYPYIEHLYQEHADFTVGDLNNDKGCHRPDSIIAAALAFMARQFGGPVKVMKTRGISRLGGSSSLYY